MVCSNFIKAYCIFFCLFAFSLFPASLAYAQGAVTPPLDCQLVKVDCRGFPDHRCCGKPEPVQCPAIAIDCAPGYKLVPNPLPNVCPREKCVKITDKPTCPTFAEVKCGPGEKLVLVDTPEGNCKMPTCKPDIVNCPAYKIAPCKPTEKLVTIKDSKGCDKPVCKPKQVVRPSCPKYAKPTCKRGTKLVTIKDARGCPKPICKRASKPIRVN